MTLVLHFSDLHFGPHSRFAADEPAAVARRFFAEIQRARAEARLGEVDLVLVTGDVTEAARKAEFEAATAFFEALVGELGLERRRFCFVPGNHDVSWAHCKRVRAEQEFEGFDEAEAARRIQIEKLRPWQEFLAGFYAAGDSDKRRSLGPGLVVHDFASQRISVAAVDSCERETELVHGGFVGEPLAASLMSEWNREDRRGWIKLIAVHHNPVADIEANLRGWSEWLAKAVDEGKAKGDHVRHFAADATGFTGKDRLYAIAEDTQVQLVLHGHVHAAGHMAWSWRRGVKGMTQVLGAGSLTLGEHKLPADQPVMFQLLELDPIEREVRIHRRVWDPRARATGSTEPGCFVKDPASEGLVLDVGFPRELEAEAVVARPRALSGPSPDRSFLHEYRTRLGARHRSWELGAVHMGARRPATPALDEMYVPLRLGSQREREASSPAGSGAAGEIITPYKVMQRHRNLLIRGVAGSGKTTWMRWTFRRLLEREDALPILIELRELARQWSQPGVTGAERNFDWWLAQWVERFVGRGWASALRAALTSKTGPRPVLMVDGWDELGDLGREFREQFDGFLAAHPRVLAIATSRPYGEQVPEGDERFETLEVQGLSDREIGQLVRLFFAKVHEGSEDEVAEEVERFTRALDAAEQAKSLARTPLLLVMMLIIGRGRPLPDRRHKLYEFCIEQLLDAHPGKRAQDGVQTASWQWAPEGFDARMRAVARLALWMHGNQSKQGQLAVAKREDLREQLPGDWSTREREGFLAWLVASAGLLVDFSDDALAFAHLGFQEYLAAWQLEVDGEGDDARIGLALRLCAGPGWWEVVRLWAALLEGRSSERLIPVLDALLDVGAEGVGLAGAMFADGLGERVFARWLAKLSPETLGDWPAMLSAGAWRVSRQTERRASIANRLNSMVASASWLDWWRMDRWWRSAELDERLRWPSANALAGIVLRTLEKLGPKPNEVAWGRVWTISSPLWCGANLTLLALRLWPTRRARVGALIQQCVAVRGPMVISDHSSDVLEWTRDGVQRVIWDGTLGRELLLAIEQSRYVGSFESNAWAQDRERIRPTTLARRLSDSHRTATALAREYATDLSSHGASSIGFAGVRSVFAQATDDDPLVRLLSKACQLSFYNQPPDAELTQRLEQFNGDPLWPALARHLCRASTPEDRALLEDLAAHPEQRDGILGLGLRYWVRGDVMLEDGTSKTLEELGYALPLLDELPLEIDFEAIVAELSR